MPVNPPADFVELADAKAWLGITDTNSDDLLATAISAASQAIVDYLERDPSVNNLTELYDGTGIDRIMVNGVPIQSVNAINIINPANGVALPVDITRCYFDDLAIYCRYMRFPRGRRNVQVSYSGGYQTIPSSIIWAYQMTLKAMWLGRSADQNASGESFDGVFSQQFWPSGPGAIPPQAQSWLQKYRATYKL